jgi:hypothetical protein
MSVEAQVNERLATLTAAGTSVWLDQIRRSLIECGELARLAAGHLHPAAPGVPGDAVPGAPATQLGRAHPRDLRASVLILRENDWIVRVQYRKSVRVRGTNHR